MDAVPTGRGHEVAEPPSPPTCPNGHPLEPPNVRVGHMPCSCAGRGGHRTYRCEACGAVIYRPPHSGELVTGSLYDGPGAPSGDV